MLEAIAPQPRDPLLDLMRQYATDSRPDKIDLGVGMYRDESGATPVMRAVKAAELAAWQAQRTKGYQGMEGDPLYLEQLARVLFGEAHPPMASVQTVGGSGALRIAGELLKAGTARRVLIGLPTWPNHRPIIRAAGLPDETYTYVDLVKQRVDFESTLLTLKAAERTDVVLLHGCCHNPTGAGLDPSQWSQIADALEERGAVPLIDLAYAGLGKGLQRDLLGVRMLLDRLPECVVAVSCSKAFGLYRDRLGALFVKTAPSQRLATQSFLEMVARVSYAMPAAHGAAIVSMILGDESLRADWQEELEAMRQRIVALRQALARSLERAWPQAAEIARQEGLFSVLPLASSAIAELRQMQGIYMAGDGRLNIAGLREADVARVAAAILPFF